MPELTRADRQTPARNAGTSIRAISTPARSRSALAIPMMRIRGSGIAVSIRDRTRASNRTARPRPSRRPAPILKPRGGCFCRSALRLIFRRGAIREIGPRGNMRCGIQASDLNRPAMDRGNLRIGSESVPAARYSTCTAPTKYSCTCPTSMPQGRRANAASAR